MQWGFVFCFLFFLFLFLSFSAMFLAQINPVSRKWMAQSLIIHCKRATSATSGHQ